MSHSFILKNLNFSFDSISNNLDLVIFTSNIDEDNNYTLHKTTDNRIEFIKKVNGISNFLSTNELIFSRNQTMNIMIIVDSKIGTKLKFLLNSKDIETIFNSDKMILKGDTNLYFHNVNGLNQPNAYIENMAIVSKSYFEEDNVCDDILTGVNTMFLNENLINESILSEQDVIVLPNNLYQLKLKKETSIVGKYNNINLNNKDLTEDIVFKTSDITNNIKLTTDGDFIDYELKIVNGYTPTTWGEIDYTWDDISKVKIKDVESNHSGTI